MTKFVGGRLQAELVTRVRALEPARCLVVPVDIGKSSAMALVADHDRSTLTCLLTHVH